MFLLIDHDAFNKNAISCITLDETWIYIYQIGDYNPWEYEFDDEEKAKAKYVELLTEWQKP